MSTQRLTLTSEKDTWYPNSIPTLENYLSFLIKPNVYFDISKCKGIRKNLAYNLQYIEFLDRLIKDIKTSSVIFKQNIKIFLIVGSSIIESIFHYLVVSSGKAKTTNPKEIESYESKDYILGSNTFKNKTQIYLKLDTPINVEMTFDQMSKKVESKKLLGNSFSFYSKINPLRQLRNKIHIHSSDNSSDTDWYNFSRTEYTLIREVLYSVLISEVFQHNSNYDIFHFLNNPL